MGAGDRGALDRLLGIPEMAWLLQRVRSRILDADGAALTGTVRLERPSPEQRAAVMKLVGKPRRAGESLSVDLAEVEAILRRGPWLPGLADAVVALTGPVVDRGAERVRLAGEWRRAAGELDTAATRFPGLAEWWRAWCAGGGLKRTVRSEAGRTGQPTGPDAGSELVRQVAAVLDSLPAAAVPLPVFARQVVGDAHGLDDARPLGRLAVVVVGAAFTTDGPPTLSRSPRDVWAGAGVVMSNVSSTVLSLGLPGATTTTGTTIAGTTTAGTTIAGTSATTARATGVALDAMRTARMPVLLTLDQVRSGGVAPLPPTAVVHVCENPTVVEVVAGAWAALPPDQAPANDPVLVCTSGQASTAVVELLEILTAHGAKCRYHGDFDWAGLRIARALATRIAWQPWRYLTQDYLAAARSEASSLSLRGTTVDAPWDPELAGAMGGEGLAVEEEAVVDLLVADILARQPGAHPD